MIKLKEGQKVVDTKGNVYLVESGDTVERHRITEDSTGTWKDLYSQIVERATDKCEFVVNVWNKPALMLGEEKKEMSGSFKSITSNWIWIKMDGQYGSFRLDELYKDASVTLYEDGDILTGFKVWTSEYTAYFYL